MKKLKWFIPLLISVVLWNCNSNQEVEHVVLISLDGARPNFYNDATLEAPHWEKLRSGWIFTSLDATSVFPSVTYPAQIPSTMLFIITRPLVADQASGTGMKCH